MAEHAANTITFDSDDFYYVTGLSIAMMSEISWISSLEATFTYTDIYSAVQTSTAKAEFDAASTIGPKYIDLRSFLISPKDPFVVRSVTFTYQVYHVSSSQHPQGFKNIDLLVHGTKDFTEYDPDVITISNTISKYNILFALSEGPIEAVLSVKSGDTLIFNNDGSVTDANFAVSHTVGNTYIESREILETALSDASLISDPYGDVVENLNCFTELWNRRTARPIVGATEAEQLAEVADTYVTSDPTLINAFDGVTHTYKITEASLDYRTCYNAVDIELEPIIIDERGTFDAYPEDLILNLEFPAGLVAYSDSTGLPIATEIAFGIQYHTATSKSYITADQTSDSNVSSHVKLREGDAGYITSTTEGDINYKRIAFSVKNNSGFRLYLHLIEIPEYVRLVKIFRLDDDAVAVNPAIGQGQYAAIPLADNVDELKQSACTISQYQVRYRDTKMAYQSTALLGIKATANSGSNTTFPTIIAEVLGKRVPYIPKCRPDEDGINHMTVFSTTYETTLSEAPIAWDSDIYEPLGTSAWKSGFCSNPVWCLFDVLLNKRYGLGNYIFESDINIQSFFDAAFFCDDELTYDTGDYGGTAIARYSLNLALDMKMPASNLIQEILKTFRGLLFWSDGQYTLKIDKPASVSQILNDTQLTNISYNYKAPTTLINAVEVKFIDQDIDYEQYTIYLEAAGNITLSDGAIRKQSMTLAGVTNRQQAMSLTKYHLYTAQNITKSLSFTGSVDLLSVELWDVIKVHTAKFLNNATYSSIVNTISSATDVGGGYYRYTLTVKRLPVQFDSDASNYSFSVQSPVSGSVQLFEGTAETAGDLDTDTYNVTLTSTSSVLNSTIKENDKFSLYGSTSNYESWRVVSVGINNSSNTMQIECINYVDTYYADLDTYDTPHYFRTPGNSDLLPIGADFNFTDALNAVTFKVESYIDPISVAMRLKVNCYFPVPAEAARNIQKIIMNGRWKVETADTYDSYKLLATNENAGESSIVADNLVPGLWQFKFQLIDRYGKLYESDTISLDGSPGTLPVDDGQTVLSNTAMQNAYLDPTQGSNIEFTFTTGDYIQTKWTVLPNIVSYIAISYTDVDPASLGTDSFGYAVARNEDQEVVIQQSLRDFINASFYKKYTLELSYIDIYGYSWTAPTIDVTNPVPTAPSASIFTLSTDETRIYVDMDVTLYNAYLATEPDFVGFKILVQYENPTSTWNDAAYDFRSGVVDMYNVLQSVGELTLNIRVYIYAVDIFDQESSAVLIGTDTVEISNIKSRDELASEFLGDSISLNLVRNSSFEQGNDG